MGTLNVHAYLFETVENIPTFFFDVILKLSIDDMHCFENCSMNTLNMLKPKKFIRTEIKTELVNYFNYIKDLA